MSSSHAGPDGSLIFAGARYRAELTPDGRRLVLAAPDGTLLVILRPLAALDRIDAHDETTAVDPPVLVDQRTAEVRRRSTIWGEARCTITCREESIEISTSVEGTGALGDVRLLAVRSLVPRTPQGLVPSGTPLPALFSPGPSEPARRTRPTLEPAFAGVTGDGEPGRGRWLFTPPPLWFGLGDDSRGDWLGLGLAAPVEDLRFVEAAYEAAEGGFAVRLEYDGHTTVEGRFEAPTVVLTPGLSDPFAGIRAHREDLVARRFSPPPTPRELPGWWREPIFCGWGAQCDLARGTGRFAGELATQEHYDAFLDRLEREGLVPGTVVIDDKWQTAYGTNEPDAAKWPDLAGWIAQRHARGQRVLLWWKAWDPEGLPRELCVRNPAGDPVAVDPGNPATREEIRRQLAALLSAEGLDADGLKIDFTARTPRGRAVASEGGAWGIALLHELLATVYGAAKEAKADALVITHTPHPGFADVTDMIRLNDVLSPAGAGLPVVEQMELRAEVARAACPELLIDTDDWPIGDLDAWRAYAERKVEIGVPSLYYAGRLDARGDSFTSEDYELLRRTWSRWRGQS